MRLTTKGRYAVTAMIDLALRQSKGRVSLKSISERQHISLSYLEQLFSKLRQAALVDGTRGPGGGYALARDVNEISIADIVLAVDESLDVTECEGKKNCLAGHRCLSHDLWNALSRKLHGFLAQIYLGDLMAQSGLNIDGQLANVTVAGHDDGSAKARSNPSNEFRSPGRANL